jgi:hypothetical protein
VSESALPPDFPPGSGGRPRQFNESLWRHLRGADAVVPAGVALAAFVVYAVTLSRGVLGGDAGELQFVPPILSLTHPTGYPLQVLLHYAWAYVPVGSVAYRLNLLDAGFAAAAVGVVAALALQLGAGRAGAGLAGLSLAFGELWWSQAVRGDKYTLNGLFLALVLVLFVRWRARPTPSHLYWLAGVFGLSLTHHRSMLLVAPALLVGLVLSRWRPRSTGEVFRLALLVSCPLLLYAYVPWAGSRGLPPGSWPVDSLAAFVEFLLDRGYTSALRPDAAFQGRLLEEARVLVRSFGPLGAVLGVMGLVALLVRRRVDGVLLLVGFVPQVVLGASYLLESNYQLPRHWVFFLPGFLIWSVWIGIGFGAVVRSLHRKVAATRWSATARFAPAGLLLSMLLVQAGSAWARGAIMLVRAETGAETMDSWRQDLQRSPLAERFGRLAFELAEPNSIIVCDWEQATVLWYFQQIEGRRQDVQIVYPIERLGETLDRTARSGRAVYISRALPGVETRSVTSSIGPLVQVSGSGVALVGADGQADPDAHLVRPAWLDDPRTVPAHLFFEGGLGISGVLFHESALRPGSVLPVTIFWNTEQATDEERERREDFAVSVRLAGPDGVVLATHDERHPALGTSPTGRWPRGQIVGDYHELPIGPRVRPGVYQLQVVPYRVEPRRPLAALMIPGSGDQALRPSVEGAAMTITIEPPVVRHPLDVLISPLAR